MPAKGSGGVPVACCMCGGSFKAKPSKAAGRRTCSRVCYGRYRRSPEFLAPRFWRLVDKSGGPGACWPWKGKRATKGYGTYGMTDDAGRLHNHNASRVAWEFTHGPITDGRLVCHACDNPPCCNPAHMFPGTVKENGLDMATKGRSTAVLTVEEVAAMREQRDGGASWRQLAAQFGVCATTVRNACSRRFYAHVA